MSCFSYSADEIDWFIYDRPPAHFLSGPKVGQGYLDKLLALTIKELPEYKHNKVQATIARGLHEMEMGKNVCHLSIFKTEEREAFTTFSLGYMMSPNLQVIISKKLAKSLNLKDNVSLEELFAKYKLRALKLPERSYTKLVDEVFDRHPSLIHSRATSDESGLYSMLENGRADFLIAVPSSANYALADASPFYASLAIKGLNKYGTAYIGCSKTPFGKKVINKVNKVLLKIRSTEAYLQAMSTWLSKDEINRGYMEYYQNQFLKN
jgi:uncharacterized protein (TIGR02285 family)